MNIRVYRDLPKWQPFDPLEEIGMWEKEEVHREQLLHRSVHLLIRTSTDSYLCRERASSEPRYGGLLTTALGAHLEEEDEYIDTILRHLPVPQNSPVPVGEFRIRDQWENEVCGLYTMKRNDHETAAYAFSGRRFVAVMELERLIDEERVTPHLAAAYRLMKRYETE